MLIFGIESSCDETATAIVKDGVEVISSTVASSSDLHESTGGIVPEVAARKQLEFIVPVISETIEKTKKTLNMATTEELIKLIDAIAVTTGPGLIGSLVVGVAAAEALSLAWEKPIVPVNHLVGHIYSTFIGGEPIEFPALVLVVSGGHTDLVLMRNHGDLEYLGGTLDDAAGEAFDKTARLLGISSYKHGGPLLSQKAAECRENTLVGVLPRPLIDKPGYDFSFSGLKTAVRYLVEKSNPPVEVVACEFENAVVDVLVSKTIKAANQYNVKSILLGGGVAANTQLRTRLSNNALENNIKLHLPEKSLCGDNAVYIASAAYFNYQPVDISQLKADPSLSIMDKA